MELYTFLAECEKLNQKLISESSVDGESLADIWDRNERFVQREFEKFKDYSSQDLRDKMKELDEEIEIEETKLQVLKDMKTVAEYNYSKTDGDIALLKMVRVEAQKLSTVSDSQEYDYSYEGLDTIGGNDYEDDEA